jgi:hypothetical protein
VELLTIADGDLFLDWLGIRAQCATALAGMFARDGMTPEKARRALRRAGYWSKEIKTALREAFGVSAISSPRPRSPRKRKSVEVSAAA